MSYFFIRENFIAFLLLSFFLFQGGSQQRTVHVPMSVVAAKCVGRSRAFVMSLPLMTSYVSQTTTAMRLVFKSLRHQDSVIETLAHLSGMPDTGRK